MICLEIKTPYGKCHTVGVENGVVSALVSLVTLPGMPPSNSAIPETSPVQLCISGFGPDQQRLHWGDVTVPIGVGDGVVIRVVESEYPDTPTITPMLPEIPDENADNPHA